MLRSHCRDAAGDVHYYHFSRRTDAQAWLDRVSADVQTGLYSDPERGQVTVGVWERTWLDAQGHLKTSTRECYAGLLRSHVLPRWDPSR